MEDLGGPFTTTKSWVEGSPGSSSASIGYSSYPNWMTMTYQGVTYVVDSSRWIFPTLPPVNTQELNRFGATAIARSKPTNSVADASVFMGELLREGIPTFSALNSFQKSSGPLRASAGDYLAFEFGVKPIIADVKKFIYAARHANAVLTQYERDVGRLVRRQYRFPSQISRTVETLSGGGREVPADATRFHNTATTARRTRKTTVTTVDRWFSGAFTYAMPSGSSSRDKLARYAAQAEKLIGLNFDPETVWNLSPWSWAVDWFSNAGDVVSNLSDFATDGLVLRYGYMMETYTIAVTYTNEVSGYVPGFSFPDLTLITQRKVRRRANPFGFGFSWDGLSPRQLAITAALGISRS